jgi:hypothetical protein
VKLLAVILTSLMMNSAQAARPEIWWAIRVDCNAFMRFLSVHLEEVGGNSVQNSYSGFGMHNYEALNFPKCTNDDDSITCEGSSNVFNTKLKLVVSRNPDGTFKGDLNGQTLGCLLSR